MAKKKYFKYSENCNEYAQYANYLVRNGRFEEAERVLNNIIITSKSSELLIFTKLELFSYTNRYQECLNLLLENYDLFEVNGWNPMDLLIYFKKKLGLLIDVDYSGLSYRMDQIVNYDPQRAIKCIKKHHFVNNGDMPLSYFYDDFPIEKVFNQIREMLPMDNRTYDFIIENKYIFKYSNCGRCNNKTVLRL